MGTTRFSNDIRMECNRIALKIIMGDSWVSQWAKLVASVYSDSGTSQKMPPTEITDLQEEVENAIREIEKRLGELGDDGQLANMDMQDVLQKQQQTLHKLSQIGKLLIDNAMSTIREIG